MKVLYSAQSSREETFFRKINLCESDYSTVTFACFIYYVPLKKLQYSAQTTKMPKIQHHYI